MTLRLRRLLTCAPASVHSPWIQEYSHRSGLEPPFTTASSIDGQVLFRVDCYHLKIDQHLATHRNASGVNEPRVTSAANNDGRAWFCGSSAVRIRVETRSQLLQKVGRWKHRRAEEIDCGEECLAHFDINT